ncbi:MAG TPA: histidine triad nucleotide-binding protein [Acidimicrobiales bacterium]|jgi:histidine triad (HIT) family protein
MIDCLFCQIVAGDVPADVVRRSELSVAFRDINPVAPVHVLVVPKRHIANASTLEPTDAGDVADLFATGREVARDEGIAGAERGYRLVLNVGADALNSVSHLHVHLIGGRPLTWPPG